MKAIGIDIDKKRAICFALEMDDQGNCIDLTGKFKFLEISNDHNNNEIREFQSSIHAFFDNINPDTIAIISRQTKGRFASSVFSFKLEGLIQCYKKTDIKFVSKQTLSAYYKKNPFTIEVDNKYQENAAKLSNYLLSEG